jgi:NADH:ubiquinone reductase (H+-translocating)
MTSAARRTRVLILGGGNSGVSAARRLMKLSLPQDGLEVAIVSHENVRILQALLSQIVGGLVQPQDAGVPLREALPRGVTVYTKEVMEIDLAGRRVVVGQDEEGARLDLGYDYLVLALGSVTDVSRFPGLIEHGLQTKTMGDILHLRNHVIDMLEAAAVEQDAEERRRMLTFVVVGAGFAGVEICSQTNQLVRDSLRFYPSIQESEVRFIILNDGLRILPALPDELVDRAVRYMQRNGIELRLGVRLLGATGTSATLSNGEVIPTRSIIATVGIGTNPLIPPLGLELAHGRIKCDEFCRVPGHAGVYAVGDVAAIPTQAGDPYPATLPNAITEAHCAVRNILAEIRGEPLKPYSFDTIGQLTFLSKGFALAEVKGIQLSGLPVAILGRLLFPAILPSWRRRVSLILDWLTASLLPRDITQLRFTRSDAIVPMRFGAGETIVRQGDPGSRLYIVTEGEVEVFRHAEDGGQERLAVLGPGQYFGEMALLEHQQRMASVRALSEARVLALARQDFSALIEHLPELRAAIEHTAQERAEKNAALASPPQG